MVFGRWAHRLSPGLDVLASHRLPVPGPHNSFVVLDGGELVMKDCDAPAGREPARRTDIGCLQRILGVAAGRQDRGRDVAVGGQLTPHGGERRPVERLVHRGQYLGVDLLGRPACSHTAPARRVVEDQLLVRGHHRLLEPAPLVLEAVALARSLRPDVCLFDIRMPGLDGIEAARALAGPGVGDPMAVVIITTFDLDEYVFAALRAGARGFLLKDAGSELLARLERNRIALYTRVLELQDEVAALSARHTGLAAEYERQAAADAAELAWLRLERARTLEAR